MRGKIPKTELLVTFEVVARHESYTRQLKSWLLHKVLFSAVNALEDFLNTALFNHAKNAFFKCGGKHYLSIVKETLNKLERDTTTIMTGSRRYRLLSWR